MDYQDSCPQSKAGLLGHEKFHWNKFIYWRNLLKQWKPSSVTPLTAIAVEISCFLYASTSFNSILIFRLDITLRYGLTLIYNWMVQVFWPANYYSLYLQLLSSYFKADSTSRVYNRLAVLAAKIILTRVFLPLYRHLQ